MVRRTIALQMQTIDLSLVFISMTSTPPRVMISTIEARTKLPRQRVQRQVLPVVNHLAQSVVLWPVQFEHQALIITSKVEI